MPGENFLDVAQVEKIDDPDREGDPIWRVHLEEALNTTIDVQAPADSTDDEIRALVADTVHSLMNRI